MLNLYVELGLLFIFFLISVILRWILHSYDLGPFTTLLNILAFIGVFIHECSHYLLCILSGVPARDFTVKYRFRGIPNPHGHVDVSKGYERITLLQSILISLAPLFLSFYLFLACLELLLYHSLLIFVSLALFFICASLVLGAAPSQADLYQIGKAFKRDRLSSLFQLAILFAVGAITWWALAFYELTIAHSLVYFAAVFIFTYLVKAGMIGISRAIDSLQHLSLSYNKNTNVKANARKKVRPSSRKKVLYDEVWW